MGTKNFSVCVLSVVIIFVTLFHNSQCSLDVSKPPVDEFKPYLTVKPIIHGRRHKRSIALGEYPNHLKISIPIDNRELLLDLKLNNQLIPKGYFRKIQKNGFNKIDRFSSENLKFCHYMGKVGNRTNSWVALSTCDGLSGAIYDGNQMYYIEKKKSGEKNEHFLYKSIDLVGQNATCGFLNKKEEIRKKRSTISKNQIFAPYTANRTSKYVELVLVIDNQKYLEMDQNVETIEDYSKNIVNIMNGLYAPLNVYIALTGVVIWTEKDEIQISQDRVQTLRNFLRFRQDKLNPEHPNDNAQLITKTKFESGTLGSALYRTICTDMYSGSVSTDFSSVVATTATTLAHMLGHNFGMPHDGAECECPDSRCIMNVNIAPEPPTHWSSCSRDALDSAFSHGLDHCLKNPPSKLFKGPICGNGFLEEGEECDCGLPDHCKNKCCNAKTCKLEETAQCGTGSCCDLKTCRLRKNGTVCRQTCNFCDLPEYCTGESEFCPSDVFKLDGEVCGDGFCYKGRCGSHSDQCKVLWGVLAQKSHEKCYKLNIKGSKFGHCGYDQRTQTYKKCDVEDVECGLLHCRNVFEDLQYGLDSISIFSHSFIQHNGTILTCRNAIIDLGSESTDPGQVPNGAKCGDGKMCVNQKCVSIVSVQEGRKCPDDCNNNGYCNDQGLCHCKQGFLLPDCKHPVSGESSHIK